MNLNDEKAKMILKESNEFLANHMTDVRIYETMLIIAEEKELYYYCESLKEIISSLKQYTEFTKKNNTND